MNRNFLYGLMVGTCCVYGMVPHNAQAQQTLPEIQVEATALQGTIPGFVTVSPKEQQGVSAHDGGAFLMSLPGVSAGRMGGHGVEPIIHGQQQSQLNIINDGAFIHGGCPNRMDPPTSFAAAETFDTVTVLKGYQTVRYGSGGTGGTVLFDRDPLPFAEDYLDWSADLGAGYESNGNIKNAYADVGAGTKTVQMRAIAAATHAQSYEDGRGNKVRSAFESRSLSLLPVWTPTEATEITGGLEITSTEDALFAGAGMDAPEDDGLTFRVGVDHEVGGDVLQAFSFQAYSSDVDHLMDNFSLRDNTGMKMKTVSDSDTFGGTLSGDFVFNNVPVTAGLDLQNNMRDAKRYSGMAMASDATTAQSYMWPDVSLRQTGLFVEADPALSDVTRLRIGGRYDRVKADANAANRTFGALSANQIYVAHYGRQATTHTENNLGGLLRLEHDVNPQTTLFAGVSRSVRTADATERFMAANSGVAANRWVGNPHLKSEKHHQFDLGVSTGAKNWSGTLSGYYDDVSDFIMRDRARGQSGIVATSGETIYRNIDTTLAGIELESAYQLTPEWNLAGALSWTYGENDTDNDALAQMPPLEGNVSVSYDVPDWSVGTRVNFATKQSRIDDDTSQRDVQKTGGWATLDVYGSYKAKPFEVRFGASNLFDKDYARHLSRSNAFDPVEVQVNEPGRSVYLQLHASF